MPENSQKRGHIHPLSRAILEIRAIFNDLGFEVAEGPEIEDEWHNFDALNIPADHPARDMQDTFWLKPVSERKLLRTHTSPVQIRYMEGKLKEHIKPPYRVIVPGKVFRNEATDATHEAQFVQFESLYVDHEVSLSQLKGTILHFFKKFFDENVEIRFRPSFFPFVEPAVEVDMRFKGKWLEMMGAGIVHPNVLKSVHLDPGEWQGFAFGLGIDRLVMVKYGIPDMRLHYSGDLRLINQL